MSSTDSVRDAITSHRGFALGLLSGEEMRIVRDPTSTRKQLKPILRALSGRHVDLLEARKLRRLIEAHAMFRYLDPGRQQHARSTQRTPAELRRMLAELDVLAARKAVARAQAAN